jgi:hypothetical protein
MKGSAFDQDFILCCRVSDQILLLAKWPLLAAENTCLSCQAEETHACGQQAQKQQQIKTRHQSYRWIHRRQCRGNC